MMLFSQGMAELKCDSTYYPQTQVTGLCTRTRNLDEMRSGGGKIPRLWEDFYQSVFPNVVAGAAVYGIYSNDESDLDGYYDLSTAVASVHLLASSSKNYVTLDIRAGKYLQFTPHTRSDDRAKQVMQLWQRVWEHFAEEKSEHQRAYTTDFELYHPDESVELFIAVK